MLPFAGELSSSKFAFLVEEKSVIWSLGVSWFTYMHTLFWMRLPYMLCDNLSFQVSWPSPTAWGPGIHCTSRTDADQCLKETVTFPVAHRCLFFQKFPIYKKAVLPKMEQKDFMSSQDIILVNVLRKIT